MNIRSHLHKVSGQIHVGSKSFVSMELVVDRGYRLVTHPGSGDCELHGPN
jgi:hypothetical protein